MSAGVATSVYSFDISSLRTSVTEAKSLLADLEAAALRVTSLQQGASAPSGTGAASGAGAASAAYQRQAQSAQQAADAALRLASAEARGIAIQGDLAGSAQRLSTGIQQYRAAMDGSTQSMIRLQTAENQLASVQQRLTSQSSGLSQSAGFARQFGESFSSSLLGIVGPAAAAGIAIEGVHKVAETLQTAFTYKAQLDATNASIAIQLKGVRDSGAAFAEAAHYAETYKLTQKETSDAIQASVPVLRNSKATLEDTLGVLQRLQVLKPEKSFEDAARAVAELQAGQITSIVQQFNLSRTAANQMKQEIQGGGDAIQVLSAYLTNAGVSMDTLKVRTTGAIGAQKDLARAQEEFTLALGKLATGPGIQVLNTLTSIARDASTATDALNGTKTAFQGVAAFAKIGDDLAAGFGRIPGVAGSAASAIFQYNNAVVTTIGNLFGLNSANTQNTQATQAAAQAALQQANATAVEGAAEDALIGRVNAATSEFQKMTAEVQASAQASVDDTAKKELQTAQTQLLEAQTTAAANAFIAGLNPGMSASAAAAAAAAAGLSPLIAQLVGVKIAAAEARAQLLALTNQQNAVSVNQAITANRAAGRIGRGDAGDTRLDQEAYGKQLAAQRDAEINLAKAQGDRNKEIALLRNAQVGMNKDSADYINLQAKIIDIETQGAKKGGRGAGKLSDQTRLNNSLLDQQTRADQQLTNAQTAYDDQTEKLSQEHANKLIQIDQQYYDKAKQAEQSFRQSQLDGREGFYEQLINMQGKGGQKLARELSAQYEQAVTKSEQIGREKGADAGQAYMTAAEAAITKEGRLKEEINKALTGEDGGKKDKARAEALQGVLALQQRADQARLAAVEQSGSQIANERDRQIADENARYNQASADQATKYQDAQQKIVTSSDQAADRKIANAERSGKKINEETLAITQQNSALQQNASLASASGARLPPAAGTTTAPAVPRPAAAPTGQADLAAVVGAIQSLGGKIDALLGAEGEGANATRDVVAALGRALQVRVTNFPSNSGRAMT